MFGVDGFLGAVHDVVVDAVLDVGSAILNSKEPPDIGLVLGEQQLWRTFAVEPTVAGLSFTLPSFILLTKVQLDHRVGGGLCLVQLGAMV